MSDLKLNAPRCGVATLCFLLLFLLAACESESDTADDASLSDTTSDTASDGASDGVSDTAADGVSDTAADGASDGASDTAADTVDPTTPTVLSNLPLSGASDVAINASASVTFSEAMDPASLTATTFALTTGDPPVPVEGTVIYADMTVVFWPAAQLPADSTFTATVTVDATSASGVALAESHTWDFTTGSTQAPGMPVNLGAAADFAILAKTAISTVPASAITGDIAVSPAAASYITGFSLTADSTNTFATSPQVTGRVYAANYAAPTPSYLTTVIGDLELAFTEAASRAPDVSELGAGDIGGMTLEPGVYKWGTGLLIPTDVTLSGGATDVWIFQIAGDLTMSSSVQVVLTGGALPGNVFWQVAGFADLGTHAHAEGTILTQTSVTMRTGASVNGRLLAQSAVELDAATVVKPGE